MVETITPVVHGGRRGRWAAAVALHVVGAAASSAAFGAALGAAGAVLGAPWGPAGLVAVAAVAAVYAAREVFGLPVPIPERRRQVPEWWRTFFPWPVSSLLYGAGLGIGFLTFLRHGTLVALAVAAVASGHPLTGALILLPFGIARALTVALAGSTRDAEGIRRLIAKLERFGAGRAPRIANGAALLAVLVFAAAYAAANTTAEHVDWRLALVLGGVFAWAAVAKLGSPGRWRRGLARYGLPRPIQAVALIFTPLAETAVAALVVAGRTRAAGALALVLLGGFSGAILFARNRLGDRLPCACFGRERSRDYRMLLLRNAGLAGLAAMVAAAAPAVDPAALRAPSGAEWFPAAISLVGAVLAVLMFRAAGELRRRPPAAAGR
jgi:hypothetical protein